MLVSAAVSKAAKRCLERVHERHGTPLERAAATPQVRPGYSPDVYCMTNINTVMFQISQTLSVCAALPDCGSLNNLDRDFY